MACKNLDGLDGMSNLYYQDHARHIVDYQLFLLEGSAEYLRGPRMTLEERQYIAFVGAAQTFGTYCRYPFPSIVTERTGLAALNLGIGGAGPERFLRDTVLMKATNAARLAVVQVLSGRSASNRLLETLEGTNIVRRRDRANDPGRWAELYWEELLRELPRDELLALIEETRINWAASMEELLKAITVPKVLLWVSTRSPDYISTRDNVWSLLGPFPQLINRETLERVADSADLFVDATSARGMPQPLFDKDKGQPAVVRREQNSITSNSYYPSPQMHADIAEVLTPAIAALLKTPSDTASATLHEAKPAAPKDRRKSHPAEVVVLLSHERSGSHLLKHLLEANPKVSTTGEICNLDYVTEADETSFFLFRNNLSRFHPEILSPFQDCMDVVLDGYFHKLKTTLSSEVILVDIKYGHVHNLSAYWMGHGWDNTFIAYLKSRNVKVVHLYRRNVFSAVASAHLSNALRQWSSDKGIVEDARVPIPKDVFFSQLVGLASEVITWRHRLKPLSVFSLSYEEVSDSAATGYPIVLELGRFLGLTPDWSPSAADKKMSPPIEELVTNFGELKPFWHVFSDVDRCELLWAGEPKAGAHPGFLSSSVNDRPRARRAREPE